jgi:8-oxo-dGTP pyrophosphatase MutT (NUDIX family)
MKNPWQTLSNKVVYENPWIKVEHRDVIAPTGHPAIYGLVHMKNRAIGIIPLDADNHTWLVGQYRYATEEYSWEIPMGGGPADEEPLQSAQRELQEETGLTAEHWELLLQLQTSNCITSERAWVFLATALHTAPTCPDETELLQLRRLPIDEAISMAASGEITDAVSVAALLKLAYNRRIP